jgi:flagellin-specific chaperone FliS
MTHTEAINKAQIVFIVFEEARSDKETIDQLLHIDAQMYANTGLDTSKAEMESVKRASAFIYRLIKGIDYDKGQRFIQAMGLTR